MAMFGKEAKSKFADMRMPPPAGDSGDGASPFGSDDADEEAAEGGGDAALKEAETDDLVAELESRGYTCTPPSSKSEGEAEGAAE